MTPRKDAPETPERGRISLACGHPAGVGQMPIMVGQGARWFVCPKGCGVQKAKAKR